MKLQNLVLYRLGNLLEGGVNLHVCGLVGNQIANTDREPAVHQETRNHCLKGVQEIHGNFWAIVIVNNVEQLLGKHGLIQDALVNLAVEDFHKVLAVLVIAAVRTVGAVGHL